MFRDRSSPDHILNKPSQGTANNTPAENKATFAMTANWCGFPMVQRKVPGRGVLAHLERPAGAIPRLRQTRAGE